MRVSEMRPEVKKAYYWLTEQTVKGRGYQNISIAEFIEGDPSNTVPISAALIATYMAVYNEEQTNVKT
jgi:hypothetical protein